MTRRSVLLSLAAIGCGVPGMAPAPLPEGTVTLGWRWVPGARWVYRSRIVRRRGARAETRLEEWSYRVEEVASDGVTTLRAWATGLGVQGEPVAVAREREALVPVELLLDLEGRLLHCSAPAFSDALPHRCLALRLPATPVLPHDEWPDPDLARALATLLPGDLAAEPSATARLLEWHHAAGRVRGVIETAGEVRTPDGPRLHLTGTASWDPERGVLAERSVRVRFSPPAPDPALDPGVLEVDLWRV